MEVIVATKGTQYWTNPSVLKFAGNTDPFYLITEKAKEAVLKALQDGWQGPPFDPFKLASLLRLTISPREDVHDARIVTTGSKNIQIEYNPNRSQARMKFSIAHEIAHTFFPDCCEKTRNRSKNIEDRDDDWQLELLCNVAAAELLMPTGAGIDSKTPIDIDNIMRLRKLYDVSTEAIMIRIAKLTKEPCTIFAAARISDSERMMSYRIDYCIPSRTSSINIPRGLAIKNNIVSECTAVGYTAKGKEKVFKNIPELYLECVGIPAYPGKIYPRVIGVLRQENTQIGETSNLVSLYGNALEPRGSGPKIIAQIVNNKTPNWGAGFARALRVKFPSVQNEFREWCSNNRDNFFIGNIHVSTISEDLFVANMIAQHGYGESSKPRIRYAALKNCLIQLRAIAIEKGASIHMPRIGTGYAGGNWFYISELIDEILVKNGISVTIYNLPNNEIGEIQGALELGSLT